MNTEDKGDVVGIGAHFVDIIRRQSGTAEERAERREIAAQAMSALCTSFGFDDGEITTELNRWRLAKAPVAGGVQ